MYTNWRSNASTRFYYFIQELVPFSSCNYKHKKRNEIKNVTKDHKIFLEQAKKEVMTEMEFNWKIMHFIQDTLVERNMMYGILRDIEVLCDSNETGDEDKKEILQLLIKVPEEFRAFSSEDETGLAKSNILLSFSWEKDSLKTHPPYAPRHVPEISEFQ